MVAANICGTEKLKLLVMGKSKDPHCFSGKDFVPVSYRDKKKTRIEREVLDEK